MPSSRPSIHLAVRNATTALRRNEYSLKSADNDIHGYDAGQLAEIPISDASILTGTTTAMSKALNILVG